VEVLLAYISTHRFGISTGSSIIQLVEVHIPSGGITFRQREYLRQISISSEHKIGCGGGGGGSGGSLP
jgi:hypothetical protein